MLESSSCVLTLDFDSGFIARLYADSAGCNKYEKL